MDKSILETVHESAQDLYDIGLLDKRTMRDFDSLCLPKVKEYTPTQIKEIRLRNKASQAVFAAYLNTGVETVRKWEASGKTRKRPNGAAMKLISMIEKHGIDILGEFVDIPSRQRSHVAAKAKSAPKRKVAQGLFEDFE